MTIDVVFFGLLHLLVFAYGLGGDLGVFYSSFLLTDPQRAAAGRLTAGRIVADVDLAPRLCLLFALPTGLALADAKGWIDLPSAMIIGAFLLAAVWAGLVLTLHVRHGASLLRRIDLALRIAFLTGLLGFGAGALAGLVALPLFVALKLCLLAFCVTMGLLVRRALAPFGPAYVALATQGASPETDRAIAESLGRARPCVVAIWCALGAAAWLGLATPA